MSSGRLAPRISSNALRVLEKRYLRKNIKGMITETPEELFSRVASDIARAENRLLVSWDGWDNSNRQAN